ncbi:MAG: DUF4124 domain-containing protein [Chromatiales bacterium]|nr:DUF4124 domain-containing protein [Chromatiales bacterium]MDX9765835.1 DUF4124 domain-containing protein [Ectothiorhodospiraceae bacterium]
MRILLLALLALPVAASELYRWVDDQGRVTFGQVPPADRPSEKLRGAPPPPTGSVPVEELGQQQTEAAAAARRQAESDQIKKENCERAQQNLQTLTRPGKVTLREGDQYRYVEEAERQEMIERAKRQIEEFCD